MFAGQDPARYEYVTRRLRLNGQSTSIRLERAFWGIVDQMAEKDGTSTPAFLSKLHSEVLERRRTSPRFCAAPARSIWANLTRCHSIRPAASRPSRKTPM
jgi:predicted DNA-binding ribbon-helix-helix protein